MDTLPDELLEEIFYDTPQIDWRSMMQTNNRLRQIFWERVYPNLPVIGDDIDFNEYIKNEDVWTIRKALNDGRGFDWNQSLRSAARVGNHELVNMLLKQGADDNEEGLTGAIFSGDQELIDFFMDRTPFIQGPALYAAAEVGRIDLLRKLLNRGVVSLFSAYGGAAYGGHWDVIEFLWTQDPPKKHTLEYMLEEAAVGGQEKIVDLLIDRGAKGLNKALRKAAEQGLVNMVEKLLGLGATDIEGALRNAAKGESPQHTLIMERMLARGARNFYEALRNAKIFMRTDNVKWLLEKEAI